jgi:Spy/CpxP family protein refolding chaperone
MSFAHGRLIGSAVGLAGAFVLLSGFGAWGMHHGFNPEKMEKFITYRVNDTLDDLKATPEQRQKVLAAKDLLVGDFEKQIPAHRQMRQELLAQWNTETPDAKAVHAAIDARFDAMRALAHEAADQMIQIHGVLTPEQRAQVAERFARHHPMAPVEEEER